MGGRIAARSTVVGSSSRLSRLPSSTSGANPVSSTAPRWRGSPRGTVANSTAATATIPDPISSAVTGRGEVGASAIGKHAPNAITAPPYIGSRVTPAAISIIKDASTIARWG